MTVNAPHTGYSADSRGIREIHHIRTTEREGKGAQLDYNSPIGNEFLQHMREDETLQAILRSGRDEEGAVVFAHTSALAECLPVVAED